MILVPSNANTALQLDFNINAQDARLEEVTDDNDAQLTTLKLFVGESGGTLEGSIVSNITAKGQFAKLAIYGLLTTNSETINLATGSTVNPAVKSSAGINYPAESFVVGPDQQSHSFPMLQVKPGNTYFYDVKVYRVVNGAWQGTPMWHWQIEVVFEN